jgi:hypothetical protein
MTRLICLIVALLAPVAAARADTADCVEISALPFHINAPGVYCLKQALSAGRSAIIIAASDVVVDLNGHTITFTEVGAIQMGDSGQSKSNVTVRNGTLRNGFVSLNGSAMVVERMTVSQISVFGEGASVRNNIVRVNEVSPPRSGIHVGGAFARITDNRVFETGIGQMFESNAIKVGDARHAVIARNVITNSVKFSAGPNPAAILIMPTGDARAVVAGNRITNMATGIEVAHSPDLRAPKILLHDNVTSNTDRPFVGAIFGMVLAGTTNYSF